MPSFDTTITEWLAALRIRVSSYYFRELLQTHPDYPSLLSITDTLNQLNIEHAAIQIEKEQLLEVPVPFLAHIQGNGGEWVMINNRDKLDTQFPHFFDRWNGIVLAAEKTAGWRNKENEKWIRKEQKNKQLIIAIFGILSALILTGLLYAGNFLLTGLVFLIAAGIFISWLIVTKDLGIENKLADQVCGNIADSCARPCMTPTCWPSSRPSTAPARKAC